VIDAPSPARHRRPTRRALAAFALAAAVAALAGSTQPEPPAAAEARRLNNLGVGYMNQQRFEEALRLFEQAAARHPDLAAARINQGIALLQLQQYPRARALLERVVAERPDAVRAWYNLGLTLRALGEAKPALEAFERVRALDPSDADAHYFAGLLATQAGEYARAREAFEAAIRLDPFHASAEFGLARLYQRLGDEARARAHLARFQHLTSTKLGTPMGQAYGDQGPYSMAEPAAPAAQVPAEWRVRFRATPVGEAIGREPPLEESPAAGACAEDFDGDGRIDLLLMAGPRGGVRLLRGANGGRFTDTTAAYGPVLAEARATACAVADYDNDGDLDLALAGPQGVRLLQRDDSRFVDATAQAGLAHHAPAGGVTFVDLDHDGDVDLLVAGGADPKVRAAWWRNDGKGAFSDRTAETGLDAAAPAVAVFAADFNDDRAVDLLAAGGGAVRLLLNPREGRFTTAAPWSEAPSDVEAAAVADFDKDGWMDVALSHRGPPGLSLWLNRRGRALERVRLPFEPARAWGLTAADFDNDGWIDLAAAAEVEGAGRILVFRNEGPRGFTDRSAEAAPARAPIAAPRALVPADFDGDGDLDLAAVGGGEAALLANDGGETRTWLALRLEGLADNRAGIGTKVEIFSGPQWQKWEVRAGGYLGHGPLVVHAGLGEAAEAEIVRLLWPTGVVQDEVSLAARGLRTIGEIDRRGSSCPVLFTWDGARFRFVADAIGPGIVGHWVAPGARNTPDPTEYVKVDGDMLAARDGRLLVRLLEPMEEVVYLDQARLLAIDHPAATEVFPNEYFAPAPPFPEHRIIVSRDARAPAAVRDGEGRDLLALVSAQDRQYAGSFRDTRFRGFAEPHALEIDLGAPAGRGPLRLLMHGLTDYFTATSVYAAYQAGLRPEPPEVDALVNGRWVPAGGVGFPAGLARTMVADLSGRLPPEARRIRLRTNLKTYWDRIRIDRTPAGLPVREIEAPLVEATLGVRGYPREIAGTPAADVWYDYDDVSPSGPYARHTGAYTRLGDVTPLVRAVDDRFVVFGSGEEVALAFDAAALPPVPAGWRRDYFVFLHGYAKDMDFYAAAGWSVEPLPFAGMPSYPYPLDLLRRPGGARFDLAYLLDVNTRLLSPRDAGPYRRTPAAPAVSRRAAP
jgi:Tfp pilus assembly protein PilF